MLRELYPENIKSTMHWNDQQYDIFCTDWSNIHKTYISEFRSSFILSEKSFEALLSLFFISVQSFSTPKTLDVKAALLTLLLFNVVYDERILLQTEDSIEILEGFLDDLVRNKKLISRLTASTTLAFLNSFLDRTTVTYASDLITSDDISFVKDLLISTNPVILNNKHVMFYYDNPHEAVFKVNKPYPTPTQFFDAMFNVSRTIESNLLRGLYMERLYLLMDAQAKKSVFPF